MRFYLNWYVPRIEWSSIPCIRRCKIENNKLVDKWILLKELAFYSDKLLNKDILFDVVWNGFLDVKCTRFRNSMKLMNYMARRLNYINDK